MAADPPRVLTFVDVDVLARADDVSDPVARDRARAAGAADIDTA